MVAPFLIARTSRSSAAASTRRHCTSSLLSSRMWASMPLLMNAAIFQPKRQRIGQNASYVLVSPCHKKKEMSRMSRKGTLFILRKWKSGIQNEEHQSGHPVPIAHAPLSPSLAPAASIAPFRSETQSGYAWHRRYHAVTSELDSASPFAIAYCISLSPILACKFQSLG